MCVRISEEGGAEALRIRTYARITGVVLLLAALVGGSGIMPTDFPADFFHAGVGAIFAYLGFLQQDAEIVRHVVGGMGVLLLVVKAIVIFAPLGWGESPLHGPIEITCLVVGVLSVFAARYLQADGAAGG